MKEIDSGRVGGTRFMSAISWGWVFFGSIIIYFIITLVMIDKIHDRKKLDKYYFRVWLIGAISIYGSSFLWIKGCDDERKEFAKNEESRLVEKYSKITQDFKEDCKIANVFTRMDGWKYPRSIMFVVVENKAGKRIEAYPADSLFKVGDPCFVEVINKSRIRHPLDVDVKMVAVRAIAEKE